MKHFLIVLLFLLTHTLMAEESYLGVNVGISKAGYSKSNNNNGYTVPYAQKRSVDLYGDLFLENRFILNNNLMLGYIFEVGIENSKRIEQTPNMFIESKRNYIFNLLPSMYYTNLEGITPYIFVGPSFTKFQIKFVRSNNTKKEFNVWGCAFGGGVEYNWSKDVRFQLQYTNTYYGDHKKIFDNSSGNFHIQTPENYHVFTLGYKVRI